MIAIRSSLAFLTVPTLVFAANDLTVPKDFVETLLVLQGGLLLGFGSLDQLVDLLLQDGVFSLFWTLDLGLGLFKRAHYLKLT